MLVRIPVHQTYLRQNLGVADNDDTILGSGQGDVKTSRIVQKSDTLMFIGSYTREDNEILLSALESVYTGYLNLLQT